MSAHRFGRGARHAWYWAVVLLIIVATISIHGRGSGTQNIVDRLSGPSSHHLLGTDELGRDVIYQVIVGLPWSVEVSALATAIAGVVGTLIGLTVSWYDGWWTRIIARLVDFQLSFPFIVLGVVLIGVLGRGTLQIAFVLGVSIWPLVARVVAAETLRLRQQGYVVYARLVCRTSLPVIARHVLPVLWGRIAVVCAFVLGDVVGASAALSLLGIGPPLDVPTWGNQIADGQQHLSQAPWITVGPSIGLVLLVIFVNLLADRLAAWCEHPRAERVVQSETGPGDAVGTGAFGEGPDARYPGPSAGNTVAAGDTRYVRRGGE